MNSDKLTKEVIIQQLACLSKRYEALLRLFDELENTLLKQTPNSPSGQPFYKNEKKSHTNTPLK
ncbi:MAG: hypothetical protein RBS07_05120 [Lentimicrobium sp.]|nr:hypothetical protein [Lentimicrobium sp.]